MTGISLFYSRFRQKHGILALYQDQYDPINPTRMDMIFHIAKALLVVFFCFAQAYAGPPAVLKMNHQFPENTPGSKIDQWFADQVRKRTDGELTIRIFWSNGLGGPRENLSMISRGVLDMAAMSPGYFPEKMPLSAAPNSIPMAMDNVCQASRIMAAMVVQIPAISKEYEDLGIQLLFFHVLNPYYLVSRTPVTRLSDLAGKRIRTWGRDMPKPGKGSWPW